jgi:hypothetical protein
LLDLTTNGNVLNVPSFNGYLSEKIRSRLVSLAKEKEAKAPNLNWTQDIARIEALSNNPVAA